MATTAKPQTPALLTATAATYYTVTSGTVGNVKELLFCNTTGTDRTVTAHFVPVSGAAAAANMIINAVTIASGTTVRFPFNTFLEGGATVQAFASAATAISIRVSAVEYT